MINRERRHDKESYDFEGRIWDGERPKCPIDGKRCNAETHKFLRAHEHSDGVDWGECRYGPFGEIEDSAGNIPPNCVRTRPCKKKWIHDLEGLTENEQLREHGFHDLANEHTETINPKERRRLGRYLMGEEDDELRRKKSSTPKTKRPFGKKAGSKLQSFYGIKTDIGSKAGSMIQSIYRVKTVSSKPKRKVTKRKSK